VPRFKKSDVIKLLEANTPLLSFLEESDCWKAYRMPKEMMSGSIQTQLIIDIIQVMV